jgi:putative oxidoreductase
MPVPVYGGAAEELSMQSNLNATQPSIKCRRFKRRKLTMSDNTRYLPFAGRAIIGAIFLMSGLGKLAAYGATTAMIAAAGLPAPPAAWLVAVAVEAGGGLLLLLGYRVRTVALILAVFALATAVFFHRNFADQNQMIHFLKNLIIAGGLLQIVHFGAGAVSLDNRRNARTEASIDRHLSLGANT